MKKLLTSTWGFVLSAGLFVFGLAAVVVAAYITFTDAELPILIDRSPLNVSIDMPEDSFGPNQLLENRDYFEETRQGLVDAGTSFIEVDLKAMHFKLYKDGEVFFESEVRAKGSVTSWWQTPAGIYKVENKEPKHKSSFGPVYMDWNVAFQGNYFMHGWPYFVGSGKDATSTVSGGCIRLNTDDAKVVYDFAVIGMPVLVYDEPRDGDDGFTYSVEMPTLSAESYLAVDLKTSVPLMKYNSTREMPAKSLTHFMTIMTVIERMNIERLSQIQESALIETYNPRLKVGQRFSIFDLMFPALMESSNEAAYAIADYLGRSRTVELMNRKASAIGMTDTKYEYAAGHTNKNITTAEDTFFMLKHMYHYRQFLLDISNGVLRIELYGQPYFGIVENYNLFHDEKAFLGGNAGVPGSQDTGAFVFIETINGEKRPIAYVVLGSDNLESDVASMRSFIKTRYGGIFSE